MTKLAKSFRFEVGDVERWEFHAKEVRLSLSEWIRRACNASCDGPTREYLTSTPHFDITVPEDYKGEGPPRASFDEGKTWHPLSGTEINTVKQVRFTPAMTIRTAVSDIEMESPKVSVHLVHCEHGETAFNCKKWGCKFYEIPNGRR